MLLTEYNEKFHIDNEKEISFEEGKELGRAEGLKEGRTEGAKKLIRQVTCKLQKGKPVEVIADELEEELEAVKKIYAVAIDFAPNYDIDAIYEKLNN